MAIAFLIKDNRPQNPDEPAKWNVEFDGEVIVSRAGDPECKACRALLARGITGRVTFIHKRTGTPGVTMDIESGAGLSVADGKRAGLRFQKWQPFSSPVSPSAAISTIPGIRAPEAA